MPLYAPPMPPNIAPSTNEKKIVVGISIFIEAIITFNENMEDAKTIITVYGRATYAPDLNPKFLPLTPAILAEM